MQFARFETLMSRPEKGTSGPRRVHLESIARTNKAAAAALIGPELPESVAYLWASALKYHGRSGVGTDGAAPLSPLVVEAFVRLGDPPVTPRELDVLLALDDVLRSSTESLEAAVNATESAD